MWIDDWRSGTSRDLERSIISLGEFGVDVIVVLYNLFCFRSFILLCLLLVGGEEVGEEEPIWEDRVCEVAVVAEVEVLGVLAEVGDEEMLCYLFFRWKDRMREVAVVAELEVEEVV